MLQLLTNYTMKLSEFLQTNGVSYYKCATLMGLNALTNSANIKQKIVGNLPMKQAEYLRFCSQLENYLKRKIDPKEFEFDVESIKLK